ncbi:MAG TPA: tetratricopeptide repeat protein [Candidatus Limnocylindrales bacterium]|jgi:tetratricopeptide (TPR) repeat protein
MSPSKDAGRPGWPTGPGEDALARKTPRVTPRSGSAGRSSAASAALYERYKDALRRGHVAALRNRNDAAIDAYGEAASIAPDRALPHASIGGILVKMNRLEDAVASYERALALAPRDEAALRGSAEALTRLGRRTAAADALDRLADALDAAGRTADATDAARRALELAESRARRTHVEELANRLRASSPGDEAAERALSQALRVLEPVAIESVAEPAEPEVVDALTVEEVPAAAEVELVEAAAEVTEAAGVAEVEAEPEPGAASVAALEVVIREDEAGGPAAPEAEATELEAMEPEAAEPEAAEPIGLGIALGAVAETHLYAGELEEAHAGLLAAARAHRRAGRLVAAIDACYLAIGLAPSDPDLHLLLSELYLDRGWRTMAADKLLLLGRIAELDADAATHDRLCELVTTRLADEPRVAELCA